MPGQKQALTRASCRGHSMKRTSIAAVAALLLTVLGLGALYWYQHRSQPPVERAVEPPVAEAPAEAATAASVPAIRNPIDLAPAASTPLAGNAQTLWRHGLVELLGQSAVVRFVQTDDFSQRLVVTVRSEERRVGI